MARSLKDIKRRIASVKKTRQITRAMKLVAGAKLKRATDAAMSARPYQEHLTAVLGRVAATAGDDVEHALLERRATVRRIGLVLLTSDRGLCGGFNNTLVRRTAEWLAEKKAAGVEVQLWIFGRKGQGAANARRWTADKLVLDWTGPKNRRERVDTLLSEAIEAFTRGDLDEIYVGYNRFQNVLNQTPTWRQILPVSVGTASASAAAESYGYEPSAAEILGQLIPLYVRTAVLQTFLETEAGEHASRMTAMDNATRNAGELIQSLTLEYNRARQAAITKELIEIVSGAEAL